MYSHLLFFFVCFCCLFGIFLYLWMDPSLQQNHAHNTCLMFRAVHRTNSFFWTYNQSMYILDLNVSHCSFQGLLKPNISFWFIVFFGLVWFGDFCLVLIQILTYKVKNNYWPHGENESFSFWVNSSHVISDEFFSAKRCFSWLSRLL